MRKFHCQLIPSSFALLLVLGGLAVSSALAQTQPANRRESITFKISAPLRFKGRVVSGLLRKSDIAELLHLPVRNGNSDLKEGFGVEMTGPNYERFMAYTCSQWRNALAKGAYAATTYDMAMESSLIHTCGLLFELQKASPARKSFVENPRVTLADFDLLPAEILDVRFSTEPAEAEARERLRGLTVSQVVATKDIERADDGGISLSFRGVRHTFWEGGRADFNRDGIEDILVFTGGRVEDGTLGYADYIILTRMGPSGPLKLIQARKP